MDIRELLECIPPSSLDYGEWVSVGMALKHEGYDCSLWDDWSRADTRYKTGDCEKKWRTFREGAGDIVTGGTIHELATRFGYKPQEVRLFGWDDFIEYDGNPDVIVKDIGWLNDSVIQEPDKMDPVDELRRYLQNLFKPDDIVGFCTDARFDEDRKKWTPASSGSYGFTQKYLLEQLKKHKDLCAVIGDYNHEAGVWIRFNPLDGKGVGNTNVTDYRYALVESDSMELEKQKALMEELKIPIALMVHSGGKSIHSIVKIEAISEKDYKDKVDYLYSVCEKNGLKIDKQNKNPSRLSRMPGTERGSKKQFIISENIGISTFEEWKEYIENLTDTLPDIIDFGELTELPPLAPELIGGVLRKGHKMIISGASKAGKSFMLIELSISIAKGLEWLGHKCAAGKVLYINLEVDSASFMHRIDAVRRAMKLPPITENLLVWNLRGENTSLSVLLPRLLQRVRDKGYNAIIIDPLYKINEGDENSASEMSKFFNMLDLICKQAETSVIMCHHHSKGSQGMKASIDRSSGSGVFARDPDAILDMIQLDPRDAGVSLPEGTTAWRISSTLREFMSPPDVDVIFKYPLHEITDELKDAEPKYSASNDALRKRGTVTKQDKMQKRINRLEDFIANWQSIRGENDHVSPRMTDVKNYFAGDKGFSDANIRKWSSMDESGFIIENGYLYLKQNSGLK